MGGVPALAIPESFRALIQGRAPDPEVSGDAWLRLLPGRIEESLHRWDLAPDGPARHGECALVIPVRLQGNDFAASAPDRQAVLKLTWPHAEARHEHLALRDWGGEGAVRLLAAEPTAGVLLLERLGADRELTSVSILEACEVIGGLFRRLDRPAGPQFDQLSARAAPWLDLLRGGVAQVPRRLTEQAAATLTHLLAGGADGRLVHADLHDLNVLARRSPSEWVAIDPKPVSGEWAYAVAPIVWNRADALAAAYNLRVHARLRAEIVAEAAGLDPARVTQWTFVRVVLNACWAGAHLPASEAFLARNIALAKAFSG